MPKRNKTGKHAGNVAAGENSPEPRALDDSWRWLVHKGTTVSFLCISLFALLIRSAVSLYPYSGAGTPPKFGDFEAQRHWMEITTNLPVGDWYRNSTDNDLSYWGLDYPPLTAYQSYAHGIFLRRFNPQSVDLFSSRGHESYLGKLLMRWTVLSSDALIFFPAVLFFVLAYHRTRSTSGRSEVAWHIAMVLLNPCLILIDHGHFQYNCISLGFTVGAIAAVICQSEVLTCALFTLALSHKQMSAYFAPAFFSHLLGKCLRRKHPILAVFKLGLAVIVTFVIVWWPYLHSLDDFLTVVSRLAPFERGIYEDYVANFWCTTSTLVKWKRLFSTQQLKLLSLATTVLSCLPSMVQQILSPSNEGFLYGLLNSSMAFYLFSFQVHEKSILLPLLPATLLALRIPNHFSHLTFYALFSMFPLLCRDKLLLPYLMLSFLFFVVHHSPGSHIVRYKTKTLFFSSPINPGFGFLLKTHFFISLVLHVVYLTILPPQKYPFLFEALIMLLCFSYFILFALHTNYTQWTLSRHLGQANKEKKQH
ncbi:PREDICTED: probable dolichyl pyrophosphate Man9GlcNAc2 alpha-1,3-glucosyltransferase [Tarenaya hassleriana]|uniref:probable dolichyl pyrophosphate Man9GlcNAc2 alpha-1,3-glucosyltransferase n=1 Tax=Tarenaya hassleriana TaxID=28532 RepID=UPI00053C6C07|nr:PREDICTED: probable dolichyl pyrophosphate Man9GlcNAc2 alpha-1,3-glucosyltransferase [Tarenaya hassleriana]